MAVPGQVSDGRVLSADELAALAERLAAENTELLRLQRLRRRRRRKRREAEAGGE